MTIDRAKILLCQMYLPHFDEEEKQALTMAIEALDFKHMCDFTEEESKSYSEALDRMFKPIGVNIYNLLDDSIVNIDKKSYDKAIDDFANFLHKKAKENNGLRLSSETRSWTHASVYDYVNEFKQQLKVEKE